jgi:hypothetical protein
LNAVDHLRQGDDVGNVRGGQHRWRERCAVPIRNHVMFRA